MVSFISFYKSQGLNSRFLHDKAVNFEKFSFSIFSPRISGTVETVEINLISNPLKAADGLASG